MLYRVYAEDFGSPADVNQATSRISYNTRYFSGNYGVVAAILAVYALVSYTCLNPCRCANFFYFISSRIIGY